MPDMAHQLYGNLPICNVENNEALYFLRVDKEKNDLQLTYANNNEIRSVDWVDFINPYEFRYEFLLKKISRIANKYNSSTMKNIIYFYGINILLVLLIEVPAISLSIML